MSNHPLSADQRAQFIADARAKHYEVTGQLGKGGMGTVFAARDMHLDREVALKAIQPHLMSQPQAKKRFTDEMHTMAKLNHSGIVTIYAGGITARGVPYFAMELVKGQSLADYLRQRSRPLSLQETVRILRPIASALDYLHFPPADRKTIVHRDIKPGNILLSSEGAKLTDFGIALESEVTRYTAEGLIIGTDAYMAPELFGGGASLNQPAPGPTPSSDRYALALVAFEMCTGVSLRDRFQAAAWRGPRKIKLLGAPAHKVFERALHDDPSRRFTSSTEFLDALLAPQESGKRSSTSKKVLATLGVIVLGVGVGAALLWPSTSPWEPSERVIAAALPALVSDEEGGSGWREATCESARPDEGQLAKIVCRNGAEAFTVVDYGTQESRDEKIPAEGAQRFSSAGCSMRSAEISGTQVPTFTVLPDDETGRFAVSLASDLAESIRLSMPVC
ncbi:serine/threonine-protein kinase [Corynebacterium sp.]|uniref:serine/threonine-protein kinase n=1 Tax=Corynebacterium sp. TaxID=1720 RepID=UPI0037365217